MEVRPERLSENGRSEAAGNAKRSAAAAASGCDIELRGASKLSAGCWTLASLLRVLRVPHAERSIVLLSSTTASVNRGHDAASSLTGMTTGDTSAYTDSVCVTPANAL
jgi:hypothetical protein